VSQASVTIASLPQSADRVAASPANGFARNVGMVAVLGLLVLACFYTLYFAQDVFIPLALAFVLKSLLMPGVRGLTDLGVPIRLAALLMVALFLTGIGTICYLLAAPATEWASRMPQWLPVLHAKLTAIAEPLGRLMNGIHQMERIVAGVAGGQSGGGTGGISLVQTIFSGTRSLLTLSAAVILLLYLLLAAGDTFLRRLVEVLPRLTDKKHAVEMTRQVERDISTYLVTITMIYAGLGTLTGFGLMLIGMPDPLLWGALVFVLGYMPYLGPLAGVMILTIAGLMSFDSVGHGLAAPAIYLVLVLIEGQLVTPILLAKRLTLDAVAVFVSLLLWNFIWGVPGALLAVPLLATFKIACDHIKPLNPIGHFLGE
jgi:predicted PurR-regulated permease PerM